MLFVAVVVSVIDQLLLFELFIAFFGISEKNLRRVKIPLALESNAKTGETKNNNREKSASGYDGVKHGFRENELKCHVVNKF